MYFLHGTHLVVFFIECMLRIMYIGVYWCKHVFISKSKQCIKIKVYIFCKENNLSYLFWPIYVICVVNQWYTFVYTLSYVGPEGHSTWSLTCDLVKWPSGILKYFRWLFVAYWILPNLLFFCYSTVIQFPIHVAAWLHYHIALSWCSIQMACILL